MSVNQYSLKKTIDRVAEVGSINKYIDGKQFITLTPESHDLPINNQLQVLLTHTKKNSLEMNLKKFFSC